MSAFVYFIQGIRSVAAADIARAGLGYAFDDPSRLCQAATARGPDGGGVMLCQTDPTAAPALLAYRPDGQHWQRAADAGAADCPQGVWLGYDAAGPPGAADLARAEIVDCYAADLEAGGAWTVPLLRQYPEGTALPSSLAIGPGGAMVRRPLARFAAACRLGESLWSRAAAANPELHLPAIDAAPAPMTDAEEFRAAADVLAVNYRVSVAELGLLGALTTANLQLVLYLAVDVPALLAARGQTDPKGPTSGDAADSPGDYGGAA